MDFYADIEFRRLVNGSDYRLGLRKVSLLEGDTISGTIYPVSGNALVTGVSGAYVKLSKTEGVCCSTNEDILVSSSGTGATYSIHIAGTGLDTFLFGKAKRSLDLSLSFVHQGNTYTTFPIPAEITNVPNIYAATQFYPLNSNPSGYLKSGDVQSPNTGALTGAFYPLNENPSGYLTYGDTISSAEQAGESTYAQTALQCTFSIYANQSDVAEQDFDGNVIANTYAKKSETGNFTNLFYPRTNPSGYLVITDTINNALFANEAASALSADHAGLAEYANEAVYAQAAARDDYDNVIFDTYVKVADTGNFITNTQTGNFTGQFYPLKVNPSGYRAIQDSVYIGNFTPSNVIATNSSGGYGYGANECIMCPPGVSAALMGGGFASFNFTYSHFMGLSFGIDHNFVTGTKVYMGIGDSNGFSVPYSGAPNRGFCGFMVYSGYVWFARRAGHLITYNHQYFESPLFPVTGGYTYSMQYVKGTGDTAYVYHGPNVYGPFTGCPNPLAYNAVCRYFNASWSNSGTADTFTNSRIRLGTVNYGFVTNPEVLGY